MSDARASLNLDELLQEGQLPGLPQSAVNLLQLSKDLNTGPSEFAGPIEADPGLTSQVLKFVNSSYFGFSREISSVRQAVTLVGMRTVKNFALWSAVFSLMPNPKCGPFDLKSLWQDSLRRALFAKGAATRLGAKDSEDVFIAALLQDMAVPMLAKRYPDDYEELLVGRDQGQRRLSDLERERFGVTHADAAGRVGRHWNLPEAICRLIERHASPEALASGEGTPDEQAVGLSALLPADHDDGWPECADFTQHYDRLVGGDPAPEALLQQVDEGFAEMAPILKITAPRQTLVQCFEQAQAVGV